VNKQNLNPK